VNKKKCRGCGLILIIDNFYEHKEMKDGHLNYCKTCVKERVVQYRTDNIEIIKKYDRERSKTDKSRRTRREYIQRLKIERPEEYKEMVYMKTKKYRERNAEKDSSHRKISYAVSSGKIKKPSNCEMCGKKAKLQGHHSDYSKPLEVMWLCSECHATVHRIDSDYVPYKGYPYGGKR